MNCILLLLLLSCCGGFGSCDNDGNRSGGGRGGRGTSSRSDDCDRENRIGGNFPSVGNNDGCGCQDNNVAVASDNGCGCQDDGDARAFDGPGSNPSRWQDFPEISRRDNNCDCEN